MSTLAWLILLVAVVALLSCARTTRAPHDGQLDWFTIVRLTRPARRWKQRADPDWRSTRRR